MITAFVESVKAVVQMNKGYCSTKELSLLSQLLQSKLITEAEYKK